MKAKKDKKDGTIKIHPVALQYGVIEPIENIINKSIELYNLCNPDGYFNKDVNLDQVYVLDHLATIHNNGTYLLRFFSMGTHGEIFGKKKSIWRKLRNLFYK